MSISTALSTRVDALKAQREERDGGFTLIELLVVVVIIGILVAIAIPLYLQYQNGAKNKSAESDLRGAISTVETYYGNNNNSYPTVQASATGTGTNSLTVGNSDTDANALVIKLGKGNLVSYVPAGSGYKLCAKNADGGNVFTYNSADGGSIVDNGKKTLTATTCAVS